MTDADWHVVARAREAIAGLAVGTLGDSRVAVAGATGVSRQAVALAFDRYAAWPEEHRRTIRRVPDTAPQRP